MFILKIFHTTRQLAFATFFLDRSKPACRTEILRYKGMNSITKMQLAQVLALSNSETNAVITVSTQRKTLWFVFIVLLLLFFFSPL